MLIPKNDLKFIIDMAMRAPSGDNCQPWILREKDDALYLYNDEKKDLSLYNVRNIASFIAHGCLLENMSIAAEKFGYEILPELFPKGEQNSLVARIKFRSAQIISNKLLPFINSRVTNRNPYRREKLRSGTEKLLFEAVQVRDEGDFFLIQEESKIELVSRAVALMDRILFENKNLHNFLFSHIRWSREEAEISRDGMEIGSLGLNRAEIIGFKLLKNWMLVRFLNLCGLSRLLPRRTCNIAKNISAFGYIQARGITASDFVAGGRMLQRIWLTAASLNLDFQPMTGITFLIQRMLFGESAPLSPKHQRMVEQGKELFNQVFPIDKDKGMIMLFRLGYALRPQTTSLRREYV